MQRKKQVFLFVVLISLLFLSLSCSLPFLVNSPSQFEDGLVQDYHPAASSVSQYTLSAMQQDYVDEYGYPDRFVIFFFDEMLPEGEMFSMRHESWYYDARGYEIVFRNGDKFTERSGTPIQIEGLGSTPYSPQEFTAEMNLDALLALREETGFFIQNIDDSLITGELILIQGLAAGFEEGRLSYVETLPLGEASSSAETPPVLEAVPTAPLEENTGVLTPQELAHEGTHTYAITCTRDGDSDNLKPHILTFEFVEDGVNWIYEDEEGASFFYQKIGINTYALIEGEERNTMIFTDVSILEETYTGRNCTYTWE
jgi:hypothetical protein